MPTRLLIDGRAVGNADINRRVVIRAYAPCLAWKTIFHADDNSCRPVRPLSLSPPSSLLPPSSPSFPLPLSLSFSFFLSFFLSLSLSLPPLFLSVLRLALTFLHTRRTFLTHSLSLSRSIFIWLSFSHSLSDCVSFSLSSPSSFLYLTSLFLACGFLGRRRSPASGRNFVRFVSPMPRQMYGLQRPRVLASSIRARTRLGAVFAHGQIGAPRERERGDFH